MKTYRVIKEGQTKLVFQGCVLADGTLRAGANALPIVISAECARLGLDPKQVQAAAKPAECLGHLGANAGGVEIMEEDAYQAQRLAAIEAAMSPADRDWRANVVPAMVACDRAESASYEDPARICRARKALESAKAKWAEKWPEAAEKARLETQKVREAYEAEIRSRPGYKAALEGRD